jgi:DnaK suppressor protein
VNEPDSSHAADVRRRLDERRTEIVSRAESLRRQFDEIVEASALTTNDDEHDPEGATIAFERAQVADLLRRAREELGELDQAVRRLADGVYGICVRCGGVIAPGRLEARPAASMCVDCANRHGR